MPGIDSNFMWQGFIPANENPHQHSPYRGFVSSANQKAVDETYPYYLGRAGNFPPYRGYLINRNIILFKSKLLFFVHYFRCDNIKSYIYVDIVKFEISIDMNDIS